MSSERDSAGAPAGAEAPAEIPDRWSAYRKADLGWYPRPTAAATMPSRSPQRPLNTSTNPWRNVCRKLTFTVGPVPDTTTARGKAHYPEAGSRCEYSDN